MVMVAAAVMAVIGEREVARAAATEDVVSSAAMRAVKALTEGMAALAEVKEDRAREVEDRAREVAGHMRNIRCSYSGTILSAQCSCIQDLTSDRSSDCHKLLGKAPVPCVHDAQNSASLAPLHLQKHARTSSAAHLLSKRMPLSSSLSVCEPWHRVLACGAPFVAARGLPLVDVRPREAAESAFGTALLFDGGT